MSRPERGACAKPGYFALAPPGCGWLERAALCQLGIFFVCLSMFWCFQLDVLVSLLAYCVRLHPRVHLTIGTFAMFERGDWWAFSV
jgi:hypothetical protein